MTPAYKKRLIERVRKIHKVAHDCLDKTTDGYILLAEIDALLGYVEVLNDFKE